MTVRIMFLLFVILTSTLFVNAQNISGIKFEQGLTWDQVKSKAKSEGKYIFVECYATWCGPCKFMDKNVYASDSVGVDINERFVSLKVQMDTSKSDNENTRMLYPLAREFEVKYKVSVLPFYLFFSPEGNVLHKSFGRKTIEEFLSLTKEALDSSRQLYTLINQYRLRKLGFEQMLSLAEILKTKYDDKALASEIALDYMHDYLDTLPETQFRHKDNLEFFRNYRRIISTDDRIFKLYWNQPQLVDSIIMEKGFAKEQVCKIITSNEIEPYVYAAEKNHNEPGWGKLQKVIRIKYNKYFAKKTILDSKINYYLNNKKWKEYGNSLLIKWKIDRDDFEQYYWLYLNELAWNILVHSENKKQLRAALQWINLGISKTEKPELAILDTKSNLLYKLGRVNDAINCEKQVVELAQTTLDATEYNHKLISYFKTLLDKMRRREQINFE